MTRRRATTSVAVVLAAAVVLLPGSAQARFDEFCDPGEDDYRPLPAVEPGSTVRVEEPLRISGELRDEITPLASPQARILRTTEWSGLDTSVTVSPQIDWFVTKDGGETFNAVTADLGDNHVLCPYDAGGTLHAVEEVTRDSDGAVVARAVSNPVDIRMIQLYSNFDNLIVDAVYPGPAVGRPATSQVRLEEIGDGTYQPRTSQFTEWSIDGRVVSRANTYVPPASAWGKTLRARTRVSAPYCKPYIGDTETVVKRVASMSNTTTVLGNGKVTVTVTVKLVVQGTSRPAGSVQIEEDGRQVAFLPALTNGGASILLKNRTPGPHTYAVKYSGNRLVHHSDRYRTVTVR